MVSPFPGVNPYLENPAARANLCSRLIVAIANQLGPQVRPAYRVVVEESVYKQDNSSDQAVLLDVLNVSGRRSSAAPNQKTEDNVATQLYPFNLQQSISTFLVPLQTENRAIAISLSPLLDDIYELSGYDLNIGYSQDPIPK